MGDRRGRPGRPGRRVCVDRRADELPHHQREPVDRRGSARVREGHRQVPLLFLSLLAARAAYSIEFGAIVDRKLPDRMICHSHWTVNGTKMSKSKGNYVPLQALRRFVRVLIVLRSR